MKNVMEYVAQPGGGADLVSKGMGDSLGNMAASYMPEISRPSLVMARNPFSSHRVTPLMV
ncbi:hypothetical protein ABTX60_12455 [Streptomyces sp. NPDC126510]|uniref:hypothetical protein n=1 Tax=Streptomyces sp. NPDC126510 TaxID=3155317 RepID=UPI003319828F